MERVAWGIRVKPRYPVVPFTCSNWLLRVVADYAQRSHLNLSSSTSTVARHRVNSTDTSKRSFISFCARVKVHLRKDAHHPFLKMSCVVYAHRIEMRAHLAKSMWWFSLMYDFRLEISEVRKISRGLANTYGSFRERKKLKKYISGFTAPIVFN